MRVWAGAAVAVALLSASGCGTAPPPHRTGERPSCDSVVVTEASDGGHVCLDVGGSVRVTLRGVGWEPVTTSGPGLTEVSADTFRASAGGTVRLTTARKACPAPPAPGMVSCHARQAWTVTVDVRKP